MFSTSLLSPQKADENIFSIFRMPRKKFNWNRCINFTRLVFLWLSKRNLKTVACNSASIYGLLVELQPRTLTFFLLQFSVIFFLPPCTIHSTKQNFCYVPLNFMKNSSWWKVQAGNSNDSVTFLSHAGNAGCFVVQRTHFLLLSAFFRLINKNVKGH